MSLIAKTFHPRQIFVLSRVINAVQSKQCHWYPDFKPGPTPVTKEEREAAAQKYHLLPEEYEPLEGSGDYPDLPFESVDAKDPYETWTHPQLRRNYMEPVHRNIMILLPEGLSTQPAPTPILTAFSMFIGFVALWSAFFYYLTHWRVETPILQKQLAAAGEKHYTFELVKE